MSGISRLRHSLFLVTLVMVLLAAGCGDDDGGASGDDASTGDDAADDASGDDVSTGDDAADDASGDDASTGDDVSNDEGPSGTFRAAAYAAPESLDPHYMGYGQPIQFAQASYDTLLYKSPDQEFLPWLATEWEYVDEGNTVLEMKLRDDVDFIDGEHFDAEVVKANIERFKNSDSGLTALAGEIETVEVVDEYTVRLNLSAPNPALFFALSSNPTGSMISPAALANEDISTNPVGSGPYILNTGETVIGDRYVYDLNPDYWNPEVQGVERMELVAMTDAEARFNAISAGQVELAPSSIDYVADAEAAGLVVQHNPVDWWGLVLFDRDGTIVPALADARVRQAMNFAVDRDAILEALAPGAGRVSTQIFPESSPGYVAELDDAYPYDPDRARELLAEAGYADGFEFTVPATPGLASTYNEAIAGYLADIGITMNIQIFDGSAFVGEVVSGNYPVSYFTFGMEHPHPDLQNLALPNAPLNVLNTVDEEIIAMAEEAAGASPEEAAAIYQDINRKLTDEAWYLITHFADSIHLIAPNASGVEAYKQQDTTSIYGWRVDS